MLIELSGHTYYETQPFFVVLLTAHGSYSGVRGVGVQDVGLISVWKGEDDVSEEALFQLLEEALLRGSLGVGAAAGPWASVVTGFLALEVSFRGERSLKEGRPFCRDSGLFTGGSGGDDCCLR